MDNGQTWHDLNTEREAAEVDSANRANHQFNEQDGRTVFMPGTTRAIVLRTVSTATNEESGEEEQVYSTPSSPIDIMVLGIANLGGDRAAIVWERAKNIANIAKYQYSKDGGNSWTDMPNTSVETAMYTIANLKQNKVYDFVVRAIDSNDVELIRTNTLKTAANKIQPGFSHLSQQEALEMQ